MGEDDWEPGLESEEEPPSDDESRGQSDGAGSSMGSDGSENEEDWQAGSEHCPYCCLLHRYARVIHHRSVALPRSLGQVPSHPRSC